MGLRQNNQGFRPQSRAPPAQPRVNHDQPQRQQQPRRPRLPSQARTYALSSKQPKTEQGSHENGYLTGMGEVLDTPIVVLFDTGASHSFISELCVDTLSLPVTKSEHEMMVTSPVGGVIEISRICSDIEIVMGELRLVAHNLQVMAVKDVDVILRMDWLTANFATIRLVRAPETEEARIATLAVEPDLRSRIIEAQRMDAKLEENSCGSANRQIGEF
ncbi:uncharacterized protein LOC121760472 [Salvia splendens]|uniref:uncharacterized protein LOC121760472 n=1 Tax=Salvia splendens TaxID=180675 RepID=UPI001C25EF62|nr:uncharacterized protein LOC121760472 [Salvia splendens]